MQIEIIKISAKLKWSHKIVCAENAEVNVLWLSLGKFWIIVENEWIKLGGRELQIYSRVRRVCPKPLSDAAPCEEYVGWVGLWDMSNTTPSRV